MPKVNAPKQEPKPNFCPNCGEADCTNVETLIIKVPHDFLKPDKEVQNFTEKIINNLSKLNAKKIEDELSVYFYQGYRESFWKGRDVFCGVVKTKDAMSAMEKVIEMEKGRGMSHLETFYKVE